MPKETPLAFDDKGRPIYAYNKDGKPVCGAPKKATKDRPNPGPCQSQKRMANGRCYACGGKTPTGEQAGNFKTGEWTRENMTRQALLLRLANKIKGGDEERPALLDLVLEKIEDLIDKGDANSIWKAFEHFAGTPKTTTEILVDDSTLLSVIGRIAVRHEGKPFVAKSFLEDVQSELAALH